MAYFIFSISLLLIYLGLALSLHVQFGLLGIPNFGVVGFWGLGMYIMGAAQVLLDFSFLDATLVTAAVVIAVSWGLGLLILRLENQAILCATIAFGAIIALLIVTEKWMTMGVLGLGTIPYPLRIGGGTETLYFFILIGIVAFMQFTVLRLHRSPTGRLMIAIRDNEELASSLGKDSNKVRLFWFTATATVMGLLGALSAPLNQFLTPNMIVPSVTFAVWIALVLGGKEHALGPTIGIFVTFGLFDIIVETYAPVSPGLAVYVPNFKLFLYGLVLVLVLIYRPAGVLRPGTPAAEFLSAVGKYSGLTKLGEWMGFNGYSGVATFSGVASTRLKGAVDALAGKPALAGAQPVDHVVAPAASAAATTKPAATKAPAKKSAARKPAASKGAATKRAPSKKATPKRPATKAASAKTASSTKTQAASASKRKPATSRTRTTRARKTAKSDGSAK